MNIEILSAKHGHQIAMINGRKYEFDFTEHELAGNIKKNYSMQGLEDESGLSLEDYTFDEASAVIAERWEFDCVRDMISDTLYYFPESLEDNLISE